jgi:hypothetical protein
MLSSSDSSLTIVHNSSYMRLFTRIIKVNYTLDATGLHLLLPQNYKRLSELTLWFTLGVRLPFLRFYSRLFATDHCRPPFLLKADN